METIIRIAMDRVESFNQHRPLLFSIAYRMLGSAMDAEDMVQETFLRWQRVSEGTVQSPKAYLSAIVTRMCIDHLRSAHVQREEYIGPWLPEPLLTERIPDAADSAVLAESLSLAFLVLLESLSPVERAVYLLRQVFDYEYAEIARIVERSEANCRQMVKRARKHIAARRPRFRVSPEQQERLTYQFIQTCTSGDMEALFTLLAEDVILYSDGGGKAGSARKPIYGHAKVARLIFALLRKAPPTFTIRVAQVNGQPSIISYLDGHPQSVLMFDIAAGRIRAIYLIVNPEKLQRLPVLV